METPQKISLAKVSLSETSTTKTRTYNPASFYLGEVLWQSHIPFDEDDVKKINATLAQLLTP